MEALITVNGQELTDAQAMVVRVALASFQSTLSDGLGEDEHGQRMTAAYNERINEINELIFSPPSFERPTQTTIVKGGICPHCSGPTTYKRQNDGRGCLKCETARKK